MKTILVDAVDGLIIETPEGFKVFEKMHALLEEFENPKIILTGANDEQFEKFNLKSAPYEVFTLKHNPEKTDPAYFEIMLKQFNLTPDQVVYFEHNAAAVESARSVGIISYHYDHETRDLNALNDFLRKSL